MRPQNVSHCPVHSIGNSSTGLSVLASGTHTSGEFTSVPVKDAINVIKEITELDPNFEQRTEITANTLTEMLRVCLTSTSFQFRGRHYELEDRLAMGSPLSPAVANIFMTRLEERALEQFSPRPSTWFRFADDVFLL